MISVEEARSRILATLAPTPAEIVALAEAWDRVATGCESGGVQLLINLHPPAPGAHTEDVLRASGLSTAESVGLQTGGTV